MYEVVIYTLSSGRIQRKRFTDSVAAWKCADSWNAKNKSAQSYRVSVEIVTSSPTKQIAPSIGRTVGM